MAIVNEHGGGNNRDFIHHSTLPSKYNHLYAI